MRVSADRVRHDVEALPPGRTRSSAPGLELADDLREDAPLLPTTDRARAAAWSPGRGGASGASCSRRGKPRFAARASFDTPNADAALTGSSLVALSEGSSESRIRRVALELPHGRSVVSSSHTRRGRPGSRERQLGIDSDRLRHRLYHPHLETHRRFRRAAADPVPIRSSPRLKISSANFRDRAAHVRQRDLSAVAPEQVFPRVSSSRRICSLTVSCVTCSFAAARVTLPSRATGQK